MTGEFTQCDHTEHAIGSVGYVGRAFTGTTNPAGRWEQCLLYTGRRPSVPPSSAVQGSVRTEGPDAGSGAQRPADRLRALATAELEAAKGGTRIQKTAAKAAARAYRLAADMIEEEAGMSGHYSKRGWTPGTPNEVLRKPDLPSEVQAAVDKVLNCSRGGHGVYLNKAEACYVAMVLSPGAGIDPRAALSLDLMRKIDAAVSGD